MPSCAAAAVSSLFFPLPGRMSSAADASVPHQDPQDDGQEPSERRGLPAAAAAHQELSAAPELTAVQLPQRSGPPPSFSSSRTMWAHVVISIL